MAQRQVRCNGCRTWFDGAYHWCPACEHERPRYNSHMYRVALDNDLYRKAESAEAERTRYDAIRAGYEPPIPKHIKKAAKQVVSDM